MAKVREFEKNFGFSFSKTEEMERFLIRVKRGIFDLVQHLPGSANRFILFRDVCFQLGKDHQVVHKDYLVEHSNFPPLEFITGNDFIETLRVLVILEAIRPEFRVGEKVQDILALSNGDLGITWSDGLFHPSGEEFLDRKLIHFVLDALKDYPERDDELQNALKCYSNRDFHGVLTNCYVCFEGLAKIVLKNQKSLDNNNNALLSFLSFQPEWGNILAAYLKFTHEFGRHAGSRKAQLSEIEVESFLYQTCLLIRAIILTVKSRDLSA
jgi:hypothetical protein